MAARRKGTSPKSELAGRGDLSLAPVLTSGKSLGTVVKAIMERMAQKVNFSGKLLYLPENPDGKLVSLGPGKKRRLMPGSFEGIASRVRDSRRTIASKEGKKHKDYSERVDISLTRKEPAIMAVPLLMGKTLTGVLQLRAKEFSSRDRETVQHYSNYLTLACSHALNTARIQDLTITDDLTGLYNARHLSRLVEMEIKRAERYRGIFSVAFIDLDNFKKVNDRHGHLIGSRVLRETGKLLANSLRTDIDAAFRYGGDEFVLLLPNTDREGAAVVAGRLQYLLKSRTFRDDRGEPFRVTASFGIATFPEDAQTAEEIIKMADEAMYRVKKRGRDGICAYPEKNPRKTVNK